MFDLTSVFTDPASLFALVLSLLFLAMIVYYGTRSGE